jgi:hypothetical protein
MLDQYLQGVAPCKDCPDGMTLNGVQKLRGKDSLAGTGLHPWFAANLRAVGLTRP